MGEPFLTRNMEASVPVFRLKWYQGCDCCGIGVVQETFYNLEVSFLNSQMEAGEAVFVLLKDQFLFSASDVCDKEFNDLDVSILTG